MADPHQIAVERRRHRVLNRDIILLLVAGLEIRLEPDAALRLGQRLIEHARSVMLQNGEVKALNITDTRL